MEKKITIKIGGVPEHFNLPWHLAIEDNAFAKAGIDLQWQDVPEGTGRMSKLLREEQLDVACILTDGIVKDIIAGNKSRILQVYVSSPLLWGVHAPGNIEADRTEQLEDGKIAISRYGSGSHLMSYLLAKRHGWDTEDIEFELINTLDGAVEALSANKAQLFLWERYMTQPIVDQGVFKRLETIATPWPSFVIAATEKCISEKEEALAKMLHIINTYTSDFKHIPSIDRTIASHYDLQVGDVQQWLLRTEFSDDQLWESTVDKIIEEFTAVGIIEKKVALEDLVYNLPKIDEEE
ncbi:ABC-type nitrate/sulfonate/bicarbonate transport system substrate-binding protein [Nonlabens xylanidelens]|uniref:ABC-type nitrate/sulfonate/bicarbonate transport system substrate-binding protein n=1 Tax=Nonlabens xylanidelens TaxID=191564 RepID=A0A2S6IIJ1_9FLAO|nr:substrate-binding domain-containing protein [Nonlabens xylanidelens]PPK94043.1 ABC-type nitrate/sulfonate/bicarbonate transport system substrate-binding protein [Nonlabens xylanidelens]PQJ22196.1 ABC transporter substrate-binding protein [Nonlabens xylanidelens]